MFYDYNSLKLYDTVENTAEFHRYILYSKVNELKMMEPLLFSDNTWFIDMTTTTDSKYLSYIF